MILFDVMELFLKVTPQKKVFFFLSARKWIIKSNCMFEGENFSDL